MERLSKLIKSVESIDKEQKALILPLLSQIVYHEEQMDYLKTLPQIKVHKDDPTKQKATPAAKLYKEHSQTYISLVRTVLSVMAKAEPSAVDELMKRLEEFKV